MKPYSAASATGDISRVPPSGDPLPDVFRALCELADTPRSLARWLAYSHKEYRQLIEFELLPVQYEPLYHRDEFAADYACQSFWSKFSNFDLGIDREQAAFQKWLDAEERCRVVNQTFRDRWDGKLASARFPHHVEEVLHLAKRKIRSMLKSVDVDYIRSQCHFGPGADLTTRGENTTGYHKFGSDGSCTPWVVSLYDEIFSNEDSDFRGEFVHRSAMTDASKLSFVPKNAKIDRAICVEPRWNIFIQLGIGRLLEKRLLRAHIDIHSQERNQRAAQRAYTDGLATIDLSSASDNIAVNLVIELLAEVADPYWLELLLKSRCPYTVYKGKRFRLEKISSMGNGYTFPLETLVFYALAFGSMCVSGDSKRVAEDLCVYGDDIIVPCTTSALLIETLQCLGFVPNKEKTFTEGNFFESCGSDFYRGKDVRPFFVKKPVRSVVDCYTLANQIAAYAVTMTGVPDFAVRKIWNLREHVIRRIPKHLRCFGPPEAGDGVIHAAFDIATPALARWGWEGFEIKAFVAKPTKKLGFSYQGHLYSKLSADIDSRNGFTTRGDVRYRKKVVYVARYTDVRLI